MQRQLTKLEDYKHEELVLILRDCLEYVDKQCIRVYEFPARYDLIVRLNKPFAFLELKQSELFGIDYKLLVDRVRPYYDDFLSYIKIENDKELVRLKAVSLSSAGDAAKWVRLDYLNKSECASLMVGKDPSKVNFIDFDYDDYKYSLNLIARKYGAIDRIAPVDFFEFCKAKDVSLNVFLLEAFNEILSKESACDVKGVSKLVWRVDCIRSALAAAYPDELNSLPDKAKSSIKRVLQGVFGDKGGGFSEHTFKAAWQHGLDHGYFRTANHDTHANRDSQAS